MALFLFTKAIIEGKPIEVFNHGKMRRDFTYIDDIAEGVVRTLDHTAQPNAAWSGDNPDPGTSTAPARIYNIGNPANNVSVRELAQMMLDLAREYPEYRDSAAAVRLVDTTAADYYGDGYQDVQNRVPKIDNTRRDLDWAPQVPMDEALRRIFDAYRGHVADARALVE